jgi:CheY-like chemotaxis protein
MIKPIYIIEDDKDIRDNLMELLESEGFPVEVAENGKVALERLQGDFKPGLILLDLMMPIMDGRTFLKIIENIPELSEIPIVVISAVTEKIEGNIIDFMKKPLDIDEVLNVSERFCRKL